jgi:DNA-binding beta-propeller fold protein YncE
MSAAAESQPGAGPSWVMRALTALGLLCLVVGPAAVVLLVKHNDGGATGLDTEHLRIARLPTDVAVQGKTVWVASGRDNRIVAIDTTMPSVAPEPRATGPSPIRIAVGAGSVWTANAGNGTVTRLNPLARGKGSRREIPIGADAVDIAVGPTGAWVANGQRGTVTRLDPISNRVLGAPVRTGSFPSALTVDKNYVWVVNSGDGTVARIDPRENVVVGRRVPVGRDPQDIAVGFGSVWVANRGDGTLTRLSAASARPQGEPIRVGGSPGALAVTRSGVLVLDTDNGEVTQVDPKTGSYRRVLRVEGFPTSIAVGPGAAWIVDARSGTVTRLKQ